MANRSVHYEAAFDDYLRSRGWPHVPIDQTQRAAFAGASMKSFDFVIYSSTGPNILADVKGRKFPDSIPGKKRGTARTWENWITRQDIGGLRQWQRVFGDNFIAVLVFAYWLQGPPQRSPFEDVHLFGDKYYAFVAMELEDYVQAAGPRSKKWQTITVATDDFARQVRDIVSFL